MTDIKNVKGINTSNIPEKELPKTKIEKDDKDLPAEAYPIATPIAPKTNIEQTPYEKYINDPEDNWI